MRKYLTPQLIITGLVSLVFGFSLGVITTRNQRVKIDFGDIAKQFGFDEEIEYNKYTLFNAFCEDNSAILAKAGFTPADFTKDLKSNRIELETNFTELTADWTWKEKDDFLVLLVRVDEYLEDSCNEPDLTRAYILAFWIEHSEMLKKTGITEKQFKDDPKLIKNNLKSNFDELTVDWTENEKNKLRLLLANIDDIFNK